MKTPITIIRGKRHGQHGWISGDINALNEHVTKVFVYPLDWHPAPPLDHPGAMPFTELRANMRAMNDLERMAFKIDGDNGAAYTILTGG